MNAKQKDTKEKKQPETIKKEIKGIIFLLLAVILGVSLFTYHYNDPLSLIKTGGAENASNMFGTFGAHISGYLFFTLGFSSFWLVAIFFLMAILSFQGHSLLPPMRSIVAILCLVVSFSGIISLHLDVIEAAKHSAQSNKIETLD